MANDGQASAKTTAVEKKNRYDGAREKRAEETVKGVTRTQLLALIYDYELPRPSLTPDY